MCKRKRLIFCGSGSELGSESFEKEVEAEAKNSKGKEAEAKSEA